MINKRGGFQQILISTLLVGLIIVCLVQFGIQITADNNSNRTILNDPTVNGAFGNLSSALGGVTGTTNAQLNATSSEPATVGYGSIILFSILTAGRVFTSTITSIYSIIAQLILVRLGIPAIVINILLSVIVISVIFLLWRLYRIGS